MKYCAMGVLRRKKDRYADHLIMRFSPYILLMVLIYGCTGNRHQSMTALKADVYSPCFSLPGGDAFMLDGKPFAVDSVANFVYKFHQNNASDYIRLSFSEEAYYNKFVSVIELGTKGYESWLDTKSVEIHNQSYVSLGDIEKNIIRQQYPYRMKVDTLSCGVNWE